MQTSPLKNDLIERLHGALLDLNHVILGKPLVTQLALCCVLAKGHLLINDIPGVGKTTLAQALAKALGLTYNRVQFTSDLMPSDLTGVNVYDRLTSQFTFHAGPIFSQVLLADEINRASPKTQSALLEAMEERQVSSEGATRALPEPFYVIATQNPQDQIGTFALPESQLDRFLMEISIGYPDTDTELALLRGQDRRPLIEQMPSRLNANDVLALQHQVAQIYMSDALLRYVLRLVQQTRHYPSFKAGLSPRAGLGLVRAAQAYALLDQRDYVVPDDVQAIFIACSAHRLSHAVADKTTQDTLQDMLKQTPST